MTLLLDAARRHRVALAALTVCMAAILPYLSTIDNYFVRDDFGVVELLARKPAGYFPRWFVSSWMDEIWGHVPDEVRPFPAVSYQLTALAGAASPWLHHLLNIALHAANGLVVLAIALRIVRLSVAAATFAAAVFVLLPVHGEAVAWITGRVDSMPALFYMASFLAFAVWREDEGGRRGLYTLSLALLFVALFTKQTTITMVGTLAAWDLLTIGWPRALWPRIRTYLPFAAMTLAYLALRFLLFGQVVRESSLDAAGLADFGRLLAHHFAHVVAGGVTRVGAAAAAVIVIATAAHLLSRGLTPDQRRRAGAMLLFFGPVWWAIGVAPTAVAGYESPRHVYLAAAGWAVVLGIVADLAWNRARSMTTARLVSGGALAIVIFYAMGLHGVVGQWNRTADVSRKVGVEVRGTALATAPGSLLIVGAPARSWEWAVPFAFKPPFTRVDLTTRVSIVTPSLLHCCRAQWYEDTRRLLRDWQARHGAAPIVVMRWDAETGALSTLSDREYPALRSVVTVLSQLNSQEALDTNILRLLEQVPARPR
jgi:hypothetical protein